MSMLFEDSKNSCLNIRQFLNLMTKDAPNAMFSLAIPHIEPVLLHMGF
jgi:uncharacterized membrane protein SirB2